MRGWGGEVGPSLTVAVGVGWRSPFGVVAPLINYGGAD